MARSGIGLRAAGIRAAAGLTQEQVADRAGVSKSLISMIENGERAVNKRDLLAALAAALDVSTYDLTGQPYAPRNRTDLETYMVIPQIRTALDEPDAGPVTPRELPQLERASDRAMAARMACDMKAIGEHLPGLLAETRLLWFEHGDRPAARLLVQGAVTGSLALKAAGWIDLAVRLAELADNVATTLGDPICIAAARFAVAQCALATGARRRSARIAETGLNDLDRLARTKIPPALRNEALAWYGILHLHAALSVAGLDNGDPQGHLSAAIAVTPHVVGDPWRMEFSLANVNTWAVGIALENGHPERAPELARHVDPNGLRTPQRKSRLYLDTGRGLFLAGDTDAAIRAFLAADNAAPGDLRSRSTAVEIVVKMLRDSRRRGGSEALRDLAVRVGVDPVAPEPAA